MFLSLMTVQPSGVTLPVPAHAVNSKSTKPHFRRHAGQGLYGSSLRWNAQQASVQS
jgi:hypothetical protein